MTSPNIYSHRYGAMSIVVAAIGLRHASSSSVLVSDYVNNAGRLYELGVLGERASIGDAIIPGTYSRQDSTSKRLLIDFFNCSLK